MDSLGHWCFACTIWDLAWLLVMIIVCITAASWIGMRFAMSLNIVGWFAWYLLSYGLGSAIRHTAIILVIGWLLGWFRDDDNDRTRRRRARLKAKVIGQWDALRARLFGVPEVSP